MRSREVDAAALSDHPDAEVKVDKIDAIIREVSQFDDTSGYYAQGVETKTAILPAGWQQRAVTHRTPNTRNVTDIMPEKHDVAVSKLVAGREKDFEFVRESIELGEVDVDVLFERIAMLETVSAELVRLLKERVKSRQA